VAPDGGDPETAPDRFVRSSALSGEPRFEHGGKTGRRRALLGRPPGWEIGGPRAHTRPRPGTGGIRLPRNFLVGPGSRVLSCEGGAPGRPALTPAGQPRANISPPKPRPADSGDLAQTRRDEAAGAAVGGSCGRTAGLSSPVPGRPGSSKDHTQLPPDLLQATSGGSRIMERGSKERREREAVANRCQ
jgi:hypothetical protein